ncbi:MAG: aminoglycoside adenylyltransferase domain-containing protein [Bacillota bacterium]
MGDFCAASSDLDFLAVTEGPLSPEDLLAVGMLHNELLEQHPAAALLEGDYAPREYLVPHGTTVPVPGCERGLFLPKVGEIMLSADNIYNMREHGITVLGPAPREVLPEVSEEQVRSAVRSMLQESTGICHGPEEAADGILNLCRSLCTLEEGRPTTKSEGAHWARRNLEPEWHPVIDAAVAARCRGTAEDWDDQLCHSVRELEDLLRSRYL